MGDNDVSYVFKMIVLGDSGVGKTNIVKRYILDDFCLESKSTIGVEFFSRNIRLNEEAEVKLQIWDTAGQERYRSITTGFYNGSRGALLVYDITKKESFENTNKWLSELRLNGEKDLTIVLVGNKCDLIDDRQVTTEEATLKAEEFSIK